uniref:Integrator complex subunit 14 n=1 Tax=Eptatretus burgeri TaxID=7764 RepID=A0A8C4QVA3_EPTBU
MPTVVLLDCSLSMARPVVTDGSEDFTRRGLATKGLSLFFHHLQTNCRLEFSSLLAFSSHCQLVAPFTRDYSILQEGLNSVEEYDKTCLEEGLVGVSRAVVEEWGVNTPCQVILVTDGCPGVGQGSLRQSLLSLAHCKDDRRFPLPFPFPSHLHVLCIASWQELQAMDVLGGFEKLVEINRGGGLLLAVEGQLSLKNVNSMVSKLVELAYSPFQATLSCGHMTCDVQLCPRPEPFVCDHELDPEPRSISSALEVVGFLEIADVSSPPVLSRHLVLPLAPSREHEEGGGTGPDDGTDEDGSLAVTAGKTPSFCVLLHGSLKVEGMVALAQVGRGLWKSEHTERIITEQTKIGHKTRMHGEGRGRRSWYGMLFSQADSKKKSNLMLSLFEPGSEPLPWLHAVPQLGPVSDHKENPYGVDDSQSPFPVPPPSKRSYAQILPVWIKPSGLQVRILQT